MMNPSTLQVKKVCDWEYGGYFPPEMELELWRIQGHGYYDLFSNDSLIEHEVYLITP